MSSSPFPPGGCPDCIGVLGPQFTMSAEKVALYDGKPMTTASGNVTAPNLGAGAIIG
jgi:hypothetical protein